MKVTLDIPDTLAASLGATVSDVHRAVADACAVSAYRAGKFSTAEVREFLGLGSRWETEEFLSAHGAWPDPTEEEVLSDLANLRALHGGCHVKHENQSGQIVQTVPSSDSCESSSREL